MKASWSDVSVKETAEEILDRDGWRTPHYIFLWCSNFWHFDADAAATIENRLCPLFFEDGLNTEWHKLARWVWCNPPYSDLAPWLMKAVQESFKGCGSVLLIPSHKGETWWRDFIVGRASKVVLLTGRVIFLHPTRNEPCKQAPFGSSIVVFEPNPERRRVATILEEASIPVIKRIFSVPKVVSRLRELNLAGS